jgi:hypothetical protein
MVKVKTLICCAYVCAPIVQLQSSGLQRGPQRVNTRRNPDPWDVSIRKVQTLVGVKVCYLLM